MAAEKDYTFRLRWTTTVDICTTVTVPASDLDGLDETPEFEAEERAYERAVRLVSDRLDQVAAPMGEVSIHGSIDGMEADEVERIIPPGSERGGDA